MTKCNDTTQQLNEAVMSMFKVRCFFNLSRLNYVNVCNIPNVSSRCGPYDSFLWVQLLETKLRVSGQMCITCCNYILT